MAINLATRHLRAFLAVAEARSFTRAAETLNQSQPSLSATIRQLEDMLGAPLFERNTRHVQLTGIGESYRGVAQRLLSEMQASTDVVRDLLEKRTGNIHVAALPSVAAFYLAKALQVFRARYPNIGISVNDDFNDTLLKLVRRGDVDLGFVHLTEEVPDLDATLLFEEPYVLVCASDHDLAQRRTVNWADLADRAFINVSQGSSTQYTVQRAFAENGIVMRSAIETNYVSTAIGLVSQGLGVTAMPDHAFRHLAGRENLITRPLVSPSICQRIHLATRKNRLLSPAADAFRAQVLEENQGARPA